MDSWGGGGQGCEWPSWSGYVHTCIGPLAHKGSIWICCLPLHDPLHHQQMDEPKLHALHTTVVCPPIFKKSPTVKAGILADKGPWREMGGWGTTEMEPKYMDLPLKKTQKTLSAHPMNDLAKVILYQFYRWKVNLQNN